MSQSKGIFEKGLEPNSANFQALTPLSFLAWAEEVYPDNIAVIHGETQFTWAEFGVRCRRLASALSKRGLGYGDTVSIMAPNTPPMLEAHYGVPMTGAVLNSLNYRLDAATIAFILDHGESKAVILDREFSGVIRDALKILGRDIIVIDIDDPLAKAGDLIGEMDYEKFLEQGDPAYSMKMPADEWQAICLNYTSGTTGNPKGVVYHHRGAFLNAMGGVTVSALNNRSVYLWTLPMFHCNGWCYTWAVTAMGGTHICLREVDPGLIFLLIKKHKVTHLCGAPIVLNLLVNAPEDVKTDFPQRVDVVTGGAAPPSAIIAGMERMGFNVTHAYGLTETYGPATFCAWQQSWEGLPLDERSVKMARQGIRYPTLTEQSVINPETMTPVAPDGVSIGEVMVRSNTAMKGYLKNPGATEEAFAGGWFHTGDLGVMHPDNYIEVKDRSKDIIISGGENISSLEIEDTLYKHPAVMEAAVVAKPHAKWGETPCAFVYLKENKKRVTSQEIIEFCKDNMASFKAPTEVVFGELPKTSTGKVQKFVLRDRVKEKTL